MRRANRKQPMSTLLISHAPNQEAYRTDGPRGFFSYADLGLAAATDGRFSAHRARANQLVAKGEGTGPHRHEADFQLIYVLKGRALVNYEGQGPRELVAGDLVYQPRGVRHDVEEVSSDYEHLEISMPATYETHPVEAV
jgi:mannose-6-phosphate isomerase-like protein (cupin superfamily)